MSEGKITLFDPLAQTDLNFPPEMVMSIAQGLEDPAEIASRFGWDGPRWGRLVASPSFQKAVESKRKELEAEGWVVVAKARLGAEMIQDELIRIGASSDTSAAQKLAIYEALVKTGDLLPKNKVGTGGDTGPRFSININLDRAAAEAAVKRVEIVENKE
jgi:hypothetical protein